MSPPQARFQLPPLVLPNSSRVFRSLNMQAVPISLALLGAILPDSLYRDNSTAKCVCTKGFYTQKKKKKDLFLAPEKSPGFFSTEERWVTRLLLVSEIGAGGQKRKRKPTWVCCSVALHFSVLIWKLASTWCEPLHRNILHWTLKCFKKTGALR